jgi:hypothetical protein
MIGCIFGVLCPLFHSIVPSEQVVAKRANMAPPPPPTAANAPRLQSDVVEGSPAHPTMADSREARDGKPLKSAANVSAGERLHSTVRLNQFTLQFEDTALEAAYTAYSHRRKKALWLRSLIPATAFHILFGLSDCLEHPPDHLLVTIPARVFLSVLQISMFILVRWVRCDGLPFIWMAVLPHQSINIMVLSPCRISCRQARPQCFSCRSATASRHFCCTHSNAPVSTNG